MPGSLSRLTSRYGDRRVERRRHRWHRCSRAETGARARSVHSAGSVGQPRTTPERLLHKKGDCPRGRATPGLNAGMPAWPWLTRCGSLHISCAESHANSLVVSVNVSHTPGRSSLARRSSFSINPPLPSTPSGRRRCSTSSWNCSASEASPLLISHDAAAVAQIAHRAGELEVLWPGHHSLSASDASSAGEICGVRRCRFSCESMTARRFSYVSSNRVRSGST